MKPLPLVSAEKQWHLYKLVAGSVFMERVCQPGRESEEGEEVNLTIPWRSLSYALYLGVLIVICVTFLDYGLTWDEELGAQNGFSVLKWYSSFFQDHSAIIKSTSTPYLYGGFFDSIASGIAYLAWKIFHVGLYEARHLVNAFFGFCGIVGTYKLGSHLAGAVGGFFSALFLTLTPVFYGHLFNNAKDIPFASLFLFSLYYLFLSYDSLPYISKSLIFKLGVTVGLTLGIRVGGVLLFIYLTILWASWLVSKYILDFPWIRLNIWTLITNIGRTFIFTVVVAWTVMLVWWPWAQISPILHPVEALLETAHFSFTGPVFFNGHYIAATELPWSYLPTWFGISLPEFYFIALTIGCFLAFKFVASFRKTPAHFERLIKVSLLVFIFCFPILMAIILHSTVYDGMRQFLFILPSLAVLAGISFARLLKSNVTMLIKQGAGILIFLCAAITIFDMVQLHPYQSVYFNRAVAGGLEAAASRFETDYWGNSYKEGAEWVIENYYSQSQEKIRVANCSTSFLTGYFFEKTGDLRHRFVSVLPKENPHIILATTRGPVGVTALARGKCPKTTEGKILYVVKRKEIPLLYVIEVQSPK